MNRYAWRLILLALILACPAAAQTTTNSGGKRAIAGRVLDHNGQPLANRKVLMHRVGDSRQDHREAETSEAGEFRFDDLHSGSIGCRRLA